MGTRPLNLETLASRVSVTAPPGVLGEARDPLNVGIVWDAGAASLGIEVAKMKCMIVLDGQL